MPERLGLSSASMVDLSFCEKKTFYDNFQFYFADVILHLKPCGLRVRLRGRVLFPSETEIRKLHCFNMDLNDILWNPSNWIGNAARPTLLTHRKCRKNTQHIDLLKLISEVYINMIEWKYKNNNAKTLSDRVIFRGCWGTMTGSLGRAGCIISLSIKKLEEKVKSPPCQPRLSKSPLCAPWQPQAVRE